MTVYVEGQLQTRKWTDQSGIEKFATEIVLQNYRGELTMLGGGAKSEAGETPKASPQPSNDLDDEIPF